MGVRYGMMSFGTGRGKVCTTKQNFTTSHERQESFMQQSMRIDITLHSGNLSIVRRGCACCLKAKASDCTVRHTPSCPQTLPFRSNQLESYVTVFSATALAAFIRLYCRIIPATPQRRIGWSVLRSDLSRPPQVGRP